MANSQFCFFSKSAGLIFQVSFICGCFSYTALPPLLLPVFNATLLSVWSPGWGGSGDNGDICFSFVLTLVLQSHGVLTSWAGDKGRTRTSALPTPTCTLRAAALFPGVTLLCTQVHSSRRLLGVFLTGFRASASGLGLALALLPPGSPGSGSPCAAYLAPASFQKVSQRSDVLWSHVPDLRVRGDVRPLSPRVPREAGLPDTGL